MGVNVDRGEMRHETVVPFADRTRASDNLRCPHCGQTRPEQIVWLAMDRVRCTVCGTEYAVWIDRSD